MASSITRPAVLFGKIVTSDTPKAVKVCIDKYVMDARLSMYFKEKTEIYACDKNKECSEGDYVVIKEVPESVTFFASEGNKVKYHVDKLVYKLGSFIDPVSGKRSAAQEYIDDIKRTTELFGYKIPYLNIKEKSEVKE